MMVRPISDCKIVDFQANLSSAQGIEISDAIPRYNFSSDVGGYFELYFRNCKTPNKPLMHLRYYDFLVSTLSKNLELSDYVGKYRLSVPNCTNSHIINDLVEIGVPVQSMAIDYFNDVRIKNPGTMNFLLMVIDEQGGSPPPVD